MKTTKKTAAKSPSAFAFFQRFPDEDAARKYLESARWPSGIHCTWCGHAGAYEIRGGKIYTCKDCRRQFSIRTGTVMEGSNLPIRKWLYAMYLVSVSRKGISSIQLAKEIGVTQKSAWFMLGRIREACQLDGKIGGIVEADETYIGGKEKNKHRNKRQNLGRGTVGKSVVFGVRSRNGQIRADVIEDTKRETIHRVVTERVSAGSTLYTDEHASYVALDGFRHSSVNHSAQEYVKGDVHTNSVESLWALVKRGHIGTYHHWSKKHLKRYIHEIAFRLETKSLPVFDEKQGDCGINFIRLLVAGMEGRRLTYAALTA